jgi:ABC-2 type transport system ATP-binding protein
MDPVIEIKNLTVILGGSFKAQHNIDVDLPAGKVIGFIGPSGAGKTTLIRSIVGRQKIAKGSINILGQPAGSAGLRPRIGYMPQSPAAYSDLSVRQNLRYFARMKSLDKEEAETVIKEVRLDRQAGQLVSTLSGGQRSRVSLAIALLGKPKLLMLDEPTVGVDPVLRRQLWELFREQAAAGATLIVSSHVMDEAGRCDDLVLVRDGRVLAHDSPRSFCDKSGTNTVEEGFLKLVGDKS